MRKSMVFHDYIPKDSYDDTGVQKHKRVVKDHTFRYAHNLCVGLGSQMNAVGTICTQLNRKQRGRHWYSENLMLASWVNGELPGSTLWQNGPGA